MNISREELNPEIATCYWHYIHNATPDQLPKCW